MAEIDGRPAKVRRTPEPMKGNVAQGMMVTLTWLILTPAAWAISGEWRYGVAGAALFLISLVWTTIASIQSS